MGPLAFKRSVHDKLYGMMGLTAEEVDVIDSRDFQRLRWIRQTGLLMYVWPAANHTRFEHSIGVVESAQRMLDAIESASRADEDKLYAPKEALPGQAVCFHEFAPATRHQVQRLVRMCALVHDLGHGPFSHAFEVFAPPTSDVAMFLDDPRLAAIAPYRDALLASKHGRITHEAVSCILFAALWHDLGNEPMVPAVVTSVLLNAPPSADVTGPLRRWIPFIRDIVSSAPLDADRLDYLARDSRTLGKPYGNIDTDRILKSILCVRADDGTDCYRLGWRKSGLRAIEAAVASRFEMFVQVYYHKTLRSTELMFADMSAAARAADVTLFDAKNLDAFRAGFIGLSDDVFLRLLAGHLRPGFPANARIEEIAQRIIDRKLWKRAYDFERDEAAGDFAERLRDALAELHPDKRFIVDRLNLKATKDLDRGALLLTVNGERKYGREPTHESWIEASPLIRTLRDDEKALVRLFVEKPLDADCEPAAFRKEILAAARALGATNGS
jgi:uncharacterized protein